MNRPTVTVLNDGPPIRHVAGTLFSPIGFVVIVRAFGTNAIGFPITPSKCGDFFARTPEEPALI
jgi:hypothetical protein